MKDLSSSSLSEETEMKLTGGELRRTANAAEKDRAAVRGQHEAPQGHGTKVFEIYFASAR